MLHSALVRLCRSYQSLFPRSHPEEECLVSLHSQGHFHRFHERYFQHESEKGGRYLDRFQPFSANWKNGKDIAGVVQRGDALRLRAAVQHRRRSARMATRVHDSPYLRRALTAGPE